MTAHIPNPVAQEIDADGRRRREAGRQRREAAQERAMTTPDPNCPKCGGTRLYRYDENHATICDQCCPHERGWWQLPDEGYGDLSGLWCCKIGCGTVLAEQP